MPGFEDIWRQALELPPADRALLAQRLIRSLEPEDPDAESAWGPEVARRLAEIDAGQVTMIPWKVVQNRVQTALRERRERGKP